MPHYVTEPTTGLKFLIEDDGTVSKICTDIDDTASLVKATKTLTGEISFSASQTNISLAQQKIFSSAVPIGIPPSGYIGNNGDLKLGVQPAGSLSFAANTGAGVVCTGTGTSFASTDVGKVITIDGHKQFTITAFTDATHVTGTIVGTLTTTSFANLAWIMSTPLPTVYSGGIYLYFPVGKLFSGSLAGLYFCIMDTTTSGVVYQDQYSSGVPVIPATPTPIVAAWSGAYTQTTGSSLTLHNFTIPGGSMGKNGGVQVFPMWAHPSNVNNKIEMIWFGGTAFAGWYNTNTNSYQTPTGFRNRGSESSQVTGATMGLVGSSSLLTYMQKDTSIDQPLLATGNLANANDFIVCESLYAVAFFQ